MPSELLSNDEFLTRLLPLLSTRHGPSHGSIFLTQKRLSHDHKSTASSPSSTSLPAPAPATLLSDLEPPLALLPVLIRATNGESKDRRSKKVKLSTVVEAEDIPVFYERYAEVCRQGMAGMKKRDRSGRKKGKKKDGAKGEEGKDVVK